MPLQKEVHSIDWKGSAIGDPTRFPGATPPARARLLPPGHLALGSDGLARLQRGRAGQVGRCDGIEGVDAAIAATGEGGPLLVLSFSTSWCGPCKLMDPKVDQLSEDFAGKAQFIKILGDKDPDGLKILQREGVKSVPQYHIFKGGEKVQQVLGAKYDELVEALKTHTAPGDT
ncbi:unnamed protein product [Prorocentrum cordatum]|uniref:Thioredoxin domain-containing protein n=1 Tax=Prorocentrum cordatum TaxID=2364126 RepID=A0ABN9UPG1_9DINO|nr:unnamed protein product [Polarella glacialis]